MKLAMLLSVIAINSCYVQNNYNGDAVMMAPNSNQAKPTITTQSAVTQSSYTNSQYIDYTSASCPGGFTGPGGGSTYHTQ